MSSLSLPLHIKREAAKTKKLNIQSRQLPDCISINPKLLCVQINYAALETPPSTAVYNYAFFRTIPTLQSKSRPRLSPTSLARVKVDLCIPSMPRIGFDGIVSKIMSIEDIGVHQTQRLCFAVHWLVSDVVAPTLALVQHGQQKQPCPNLARRLEDYRTSERCGVALLDWKVRVLTAFFASTTIQKGSVSIRA